MKKSLRFASAALALSLAAGLTLPAFAATKNAFEKDETIYAVMNADGSVSSRTISEHLYSENGLSSVTDKSTLTNIENTQSDAAFTQDGDSLVWSTDDTDVYYKGDSDRSLPISANITYTLDGQTAPLEELLGKSGHLTITVDLTNNETGTVEVDGKQRTIVTPFITAVGVILDENATNVNAEHGLLESAANSSVAAFVCLPGVKDSLDGLLPDSISALDDYVRDSVTVEADVEDLTAPSIMFACATSTAALSDGESVFDFDSLNELTDGLSALNDAMSQLLDGASQLVDGAAQLASGSLALMDGANQLDSGLGELTNGLDTLASNNAALVSATQQVADGVLSSANDTLIEGGLIDEPMTWENYNSVLDEVLTLNEKTLAAGRKKMVRTIWEQEPSFKESQLDLALYLAATQTGDDLEAALRLMQNLDPSMLSSAVAMNTDADAQQKIHDELYLQVENSDDIASVRALQESLNQLQVYVSSVNQYTAGVASAADGAHSAKDGSAQLASGAKTLYDGVNQFTDGTNQLSNGLTQFNDEGISQLTGALDTDQLHSLKTVLDEMETRLDDYDSFAGSPDGAVNKVKFIYKTSETVESAADAESTDTAAEEEGNFFTRLWAKIVALFQF